MTSLDQLEAFSSLPTQDRLLWIHSEASYSWGLNSESELESSYQRYIRSLDRWANKGGRLIWTVHDEGLHLNDPDHRRINAIRVKLRDMAEYIHVHSNAAKLVVAQKFGVEFSKIVVFKHPSYSKLYNSAPLSSDEKEIQHFRKLLCFGHIKNYKNYNGLANALDKIGPHSFSKLTIAGQLDRSVELPVDIFKKNVDLDLQLGFVPDYSVSELFGDAHFLVLPYTESLTSGAAALSMGFGVPVIAPDLGGMREAVPEECHPLIYDARDPNGLIDALRIARDMTPAAYGNLARSCREFGDAIHPDVISTAFRRFLSDSGLFR